MFGKFGLITFLVICVGGKASGQHQNNNSYLLHPIWVEAEVIGILEHHSALAVLHITRVDSTNEINLSEDSEILSEFVFGTKPTEGDPKLVGIKQNMLIRAEIDGKFNSSSGQWDYRIFRYRSIEP